MNWHEDENLSNDEFDLDICFTASYSSPAPHRNNSLESCPDASCAGTCDSCTCDSVCTACTIC